MMKRPQGNHTDFMAIVRFGSFGLIRLLLLSVLLFGCSDPSNRQPSTVADPSNPEPSKVARHVLVLAANNTATPQIGYTGLDALSYKFSDASFTFEVGPDSGTPWLTGKGKMQISQTNNMTITIDSTSERPYEIRLLGLAKTSDVQSNDPIEETIPVAAGKQNLKVDRFLIFTHDFSRQ